MYGHPGFSKRIQTYTKHVLGSNSYFFSKQQECQAVFIKYSPTAFLTYSFADHRCKTLHRLLGTENASATEKTEALRNNAHIAAWYFDARIKAIRKYIHKELLDVEYEWVRYEFQGRGTIHVHIAIRLKGEKGRLAESCMEVYLLEKVIKEKEMQLKYDVEITEEIKKLETEKKTKMEAIVKIINIVIEAKNPLPTKDEQKNFEFPAIHPSEKEYYEIEEKDKEKDL